MSYDCKSPEEVLKTIKDDKIEMVDLRFADLPGLWQHFSGSASGTEPRQLCRGRRLSIPARSTRSNRRGGACAGGWLR